MDTFWPVFMGDHDLYVWYFFYNRLWTPCLYFRNLYYWDKSLSN